jgi:hypothetical protein
MVTSIEVSDLRHKVIAELEWDPSSVKGNWAIPTRVHQHHG